MFTVGRGNCSPEIFKMAREAGLENYNKLQSVYYLLQGVLEFRILFLVFGTKGYTHYWKSSSHQPGSGNMSSVVKLGRLNASVSGSLRCHCRGETSLELFRLWRWCSVFLIMIVKFFRF